MSGIRITVEDIETGDTESVEIENDYLIICDGNRYVDYTAAHANGTHVLTVKRRSSGSSSIRDDDE